MDSHASQPWTASTPCAADPYDDISPDTAFATDSAVFENSSSSSSGTHIRKPPGSITPNACTSCKKARAKCDGKKPACYRCTARQIPNSCRYEIHSKAVKEKLMSEIYRLRKENQQLAQENLDLGQSNDSLEEIFRSLKDDQKGREIIHLLKLGQDHQSIAAWLSQPHLSLDSTKTHLFPASLQPFVEQVESNWQHPVFGHPTQRS